MNKHHKRTLKLQSQRYVFINGDLYYKDKDSFLLFCLDECQAKVVLKDMHSGVCGGNFTTSTISQKVLRVSYFWLTLFKDAHTHVQKCESCQKFSGRLKYSRALQIRLVQVESPFYQWGIDFIGEIAEISSGPHKWILTSTDYLTKWVEAIPKRQAISRTVINFLIDNIITRFGVLVRLIMDNVMSFRSEEFIGL